MCVLRSRAGCGTRNKRYKVVLNNIVMVFLLRKEEERILQIATQNRSLVCNGRIGLLAFFRSTAGSLFFFSLCGVAVMSQVLSCLLHVFYREGVVRDMGGIIPQLLPPPPSLFPSPLLPLSAAPLAHLSTPAFTAEHLISCYGRRRTIFRTITR